MREYRIKGCVVSMCDWEAGYKSNQSVYLASLGMVGMEERPSWEKSRANELSLYSYISR